MVFKLPSARCLSKASREGALRENMAKADISASSKGISPSSTSSSTMVAKCCMKQAEERIGTEMFASFWRHHGHRNPQSDVLGMRNRSGESRIVAFMFTKGQVERWRAYWDLLTSGSCCYVLTFRKKKCSGASQRCRFAHYAPRCPADCLLQVLIFTRPRAANSAHNTHCVASPPQARA